jgi:hypothetical protein
MKSNWYFCQFSQTHRTISIVITVGYGQMRNAACGQIKTTPAVPLVFNRSGKIGDSTMKRSSLLAVIAVSMLALAQAWAQDVRYNFDKNTDFSKFKTYKWVPLKDAQPLDAIIDKDIKDSVDNQLATKGLTKTEGENADLLVGYQGAVGQEKQFSSYSSDFGYGAGWRGGGWYGGGMGSTYTTGQTSTIYIGQIAVDMYDSANKDLVWRGTASKTIDPKAKPDKQQKNLNKAMAKLFKNYPPKPKE